MSESGTADVSSPRESFSRLLNRKSAGSGLTGSSILLVDDKPELLNSLYQLMVLHGYEPDKALGGQQALDLMAEKSYDVVLLDLIMPGVSGHDVLDYADRNELTCKIIVVSGDSSFSGVKHALHCGAFDFVKKPYEAGELIATMETALRQCQLEAQNELMEEKLKESEELHRYIVNSSPDLVYMLDRNGCFTFLNDRVESLLGFAREQLIGKHYTELVDDDHLELARNVFNERRTGERAVTNAEMRLKSRHARRGARFFHAHAIWTELTAMGVYSDPKERTRENFVGTYGIARDISDRKEAQEVISFQAYHDLLTHLPNRALLKDRLSLAIKQARRSKRKLAVMFLDLDRFKIVNDTLGHSMGDRLLKAVANRLESCLRRGDTLSRFGGDEFTLLLPEVRTRDDVVVIATKILDRLGGPFVIDGHELFVGASIGIAIYPEAGETEEALIQNADIAMYHVKGRGKNSYQFFSEEMNHKYSTRLSMERELRNGLTQEELVVYYQPQVALETGQIVGVEALVRWRHPERGLVEPGDFLPMAEETGLITQIDTFVQRRAFADVAGWRRAGLGDIRLSVNLSAPQIEQENFVDSFVADMATAGIDAPSIKLEITENILMQDMEVIIPKLKQLRQLGVQIAIDDFGTGYSSLSYLQQFPIDTLKIDRSFVGDIRAEQGDASIVNAIVAMARGLNLDLIAEGVENRTQLRYLRSQGCSEVQGFIFSDPVPADQVKLMLQQNPFRAMVLDEQPETADAV
ncbi:MAG: EAL domain-containing protein [Pseudomonadales bacterium]|nr:EAL domain-containing protein [Pseudomonadales bacterium]NIX08983.1 EAL domain-containing protein [Pseudomonadales bacterium]